MIYISLIILVYCYIKNFKESNRFFTPNQLFYTSIFLLYIIPGIVESSEVTDLYVLIFLITYAIIEKQSLILRSKNDLVYIPILNYVVFGLLIKTLYIYIAVDYSIDQVVQLIIDPRSFTYISESMGPFIIVIGAYNSLLLFIAISNLVVIKKIKLELLLLIINSGIGASKSSFITFTLMVAIIYQSYFYFNNIKIFWFIVLMAIMGYASFAIYGEAGVVNFDFDYVENKLKNYFVEYKSTSNVINDFSFSFTYLYDLIYQTLIAMFPRVLWEDKPYVSFYHTYWRDIYEPGTPIYHTTTYGFMAEASMAFGIIGPILYAIIFNFYISKTNRLIVSEIYYYRFTGYALMVLIFYFVRAGFFFTTLWQLIITTIIFYIIFKFLKIKKLKKYEAINNNIPLPSRK